MAAAGIGREMAAARRTMVDHDLAAAVTAAYGRVLVAEAATRVRRRGRGDRARGPRALRQPA